uniref:Uncharacterized protein n=1 Tax=Anguilla anguilla TaxID=7936 RepID=A0A0E9R318_ANGAN
MVEFVSRKKIKTTECIYDLRARSFITT